MINRFCKTALWECSKTLIAVAQGHEPAETVIRNAKLVNVNTREIQEGTDVAIACGRIAYVGDADHCIGASQGHRCTGCIFSDFSTATFMSSLP
ncbi:MAG: hypothetical protein ACLT98_12200 [Eggerthellaceae bacterium]